MEPTPPAKRGFTLFRRDFLTGAVAGLTGSAAAGYLAPLEWKQKAFPVGTKLTFSQSGEDLIVAGLFKEFKIDKPTYLDVGAFHPIIGSNTYALYRQGGRGVLVEPNVDMIADLRSVRPGDTVLNIGIGLDDTQEADFYVLNYPQMSSFDGDDARSRERDSGGATFIKRVVKMPMVNINKVIDEHFAKSAPDFLSIDTEGLDLTILKTIDFGKFRPKIITAETTAGGGTVLMSPEIGDFLAGKDYMARGMTLANTIFVDKKILR